MYECEPKESVVLYARCNKIHCDDKIRQKKIILYVDHDRLLQTIKYVVITILNLVRTLMSILIFQNNDYRVLAQEAHDNSTETIQSPVTSSLLSHYLCGTSSSYESSCSSIDQT
jgi:hypothetical protein